MEGTQVVHMNGGDGETSYAKNSLLQRKGISITKPIMEAAITGFYSSNLGTTTRIVIADLGCSSGPNTLLAVTELINMVGKLCNNKGQKSPPEYQIFLNDLPGNDFNSIFRYLLGIHGRSLLSDDQMGANCFFSGVPGSFYGRLFPSNTLHFVHSSFSLHWLSQVPQGLEGNKGNIYMASSSPRSVLEAYYKQFMDDFAMFLKCRAQEVVAGGRMVLTIPGRISEDRASDGLCTIWKLLALAISEMVSEGLIEKEKMDGFHFPTYTPSPLEVKAEVLKEGSFFIDRLETSQVNWSGYDDNSDYENNGGGIEEAYTVARGMRAVTEPLVLNHFGEGIIEDVFHRYKLHIVDHMSKEKTNKFIIVIVSLVRR